MNMNIMCSVYRPFPCDFTHFSISYSARVSESLFGLVGLLISLFTWVQNKVRVQNLVNPRYDIVCQQNSISLYYDVQRQTHMELSVMFFKIKSGITP